MRYGSSTRRPTFACAGPSSGRDSLHAAVAARRQGEEAFGRFHSALLTLKHDEGKDHGQRATLIEAATRAGLDRNRFTADLDDRTLLQDVRDDYLHGRETYGV